jgi:Putative beta-lactamase-inhibitor-like, PepSY-like
MKKYIVVLTLAIIAGASVNCQSIKVPSAVTAAFNAKFPNATHVRWGKENAKEYEAEFKVGSNAISANFSTDGTWVETESVIPISEVPAAVKDAVMAKYPGAAITLAEKTEQPGNKVLYELSFSVNGKKKSMELKPDGTPED